MPLFALTVFLSAFLLFQIQPMVAKMILPWFGGSSSVWSTCMVFFQAELLLGYLYVHWLHETLAPRRQTLLHVVLLLSLAALMVSQEFVDGYHVVVRNFYSQLRVSERTDEKPGLKRVMVHGRINHGEQYLADEHRRTPTAYYCHESGVGRAIFALPQDRPLKLGVVGLGAGTLSAYGRRGDEVRIYEINEQVLELARSQFTYLADSPARIVPVLGDGRLMLEREPDQGFDLLAMDAFSGDSIPAHLLTLEAMQTYLRHLRPDGILAVHITNRYLDLQPVMAAAAQHYGKTALLYALEPDDDDDFCLSSDWALIMSPERAKALPLVMNDGVPLAPKPGFRAWTDAFSNLFSVLK